MAMLMFLVVSQYDANFDGGKMMLILDTVCTIKSVSLQLNPTVPRILAMESEKNPVIVNVMCYSQKDGCN